MFTIAQISAILGLLLAFNVSQSTVNTVQSILEGNASSSIQIVIPTPVPTPSLQVITPPSANSGGESGVLPVPPVVLPQVSVSNYEVVGSLSDGTWARSLASLTISAGSDNAVTNRIYVRTSRLSVINLSIGGVSQYVRNNGTTTLVSFGNLTGTSSVNLIDPTPAGSYLVTVVGIGYTNSTGYKEILGLDLPITFTIH